MYKILIDGKKLTVFDSDARRLQVMKGAAERSTPYLSLDVEIEVLDNLFKQERMFALIAAARSLKETGGKLNRERAAHYLICARAERKSFTEGNRA